MRIKAIKLYQAVYVDKKMVTHINLENLRGSNIVGKDVSLKFVEGMGVMVETETDCVIISFNNLAAIQIYKEEAAPKKATAKGA